ncbi:aminodeoxychorismate lyase [Methylomonas sp. SURF-2]|uniref:Aminodeoxychorismate lyase n=1 Tax=Methylomonas subterranea TaxID=2952225 RepID=A0ABT1TE37_9GAMM|nr:aminodeoxychorismate lyase [Methylomonas sp. SURF-2]MCQ8103554.1 aminodeoxychorismate lyase [Methylomonas sp. SURF-2]
MFLLNGESRHCIDASDRGFQYGDGLFETIAVCNGKPLFWDQHLARLTKGCQRLSLPLPDPALFAAEARQLSAGVDRAVLKLIVTRGSGGRGYRQPEPIMPTRLFSLHPYPDYPDSFHEQGIVARFCRQRLARNPSLAGIKHLNRLEQVLARAEWRDDTVQEGVMLDYDEHVVEGTMSNLFFVKQGLLHTPSLTNCGIEGIVRKIVIEFAIRNGLGLAENHFNMQSVLEADEVFVTNSVIGIWPVKQLDSQCFGVGGITRDMQQWYARARNREANL